MPTYNITSFYTLNTPTTVITGEGGVSVLGANIGDVGVSVRLRLTTNPNYYYDYERPVFINSNTDVDSTNDFIFAPGHTFEDGDDVFYYTVNGNTAITGLTNLTIYGVVSSNSSGFKLFDTGVVNITANTTDTGANTAGHVIGRYYSYALDPNGQKDVVFGDGYIHYDTVFGHPHSPYIPYTSSSYSWELVLTNQGVVNGTPQAVTVEPYKPALLGNDPNDTTWKVVELTTKPKDTSIFYISNGTFIQANSAGDQIEYITLEGVYYPNTLPTWTVDANGYISSGPTNLHINYANLYWRYWSGTSNVWSANATAFGYANVGTGSIAGFVYNDIDSDGVFDAGESGLANVLVTVSGSASASQRTHANGYYKFNLANGTYTVTVTPPSGYTNTTATALSSLVLNDAVSLTKTDLTSKNFGLKLATYSISGNVYLDNAQNGVQDVGDAAQLGVTVSLSGDATSSTTTASNGYYVFSSLLPGSYTVTLTLPAGKTNTNPRIINQTITSANVPGQGFGLWYLPANVAGNVYIDSDLDGVFDVGESGKQSVRLDLYNFADLTTSIANTTSAANGFYQFGPLSTNNYRVAMTLPVGYTNTSSKNLTAVLVGIDLTRNFGLRQTMWPLSGRVFIDTNNNGVDDAEDPYEGLTITLSGTSSDTNTSIANGYYSFLLANGTYNVALSVPGGYTNTTPSTISSIVIAGADSGDHSFGIRVESIKLSGHAFLDADEDGINDAEAGLQDVTIQVLDGDWSNTTNTAANGFFCFDVDAGTYDLVVTAYPAGYHNTTGDTISGIVVAANVSDQDFGFWYDTMTISGHVFVDTDIDGVMDGGESGIGGVTINLNGDAMDTTTSAANGYFEFTGLIPGTYGLVEIQPDGYDSTTPNFINGIVLSSSNSINNDFGEIAIVEDSTPTPSGIFLTKYVNPFANGDIVRYYVNYLEFNPTVDISSNFISIPDNTLANDDYVVYWRTNTNIIPVGGITPNTTYYVRDANTSGFKLAATVGGAVITLTPPSGISNTIQIASGGRGYDSTVNNQLIFTGGNAYAIGSGSVLPIATFANNANGTIISITITGTGSGYTGNPVVTVNTAAMANVTNSAILVARLNKGQGHQLLTRTPVDGLEHFQSYYVVNTTPKYIKLSNTYPGTPIDITASSIQENGHFIRRLDEDQT